MKYILRFFGLIRVKDIDKYLADEMKYWEDKRSGLTDTFDILHENQTNQFSYYREMCQRIKTDIYFLNRIV